MGRAWRAMLLGATSLALGCATGASLDDPGAAGGWGGTDDASVDGDATPDTSGEAEPDASVDPDAADVATTDASVDPDAADVATSDASVDPDATDASGDDATADVAPEASDPCATVACTTPPASYCSAASTRVVYDVPGACAAGTCAYPSTHDEYCAYGCVGGSCRACNADGDCPGGNRCDAGACVACDTVDHCGASCAPCGASQACTARVCVDIGCPPPAVSCTTGTESRDRCAGARTIGRKVAGSASGYSIASNTCSASNRFDVCSWDAGADHAYRLYLRGSETMSMTLTTGSGCVTSSWGSTLHVFSNAGCADTTCPKEEFCADFFTGTRAYTAPRDGWYIIVVDGSTAFDDEGDYTLKVKLSCKVAGCECP